MLRILLLVTLALAFVAVITGAASVRRVLLTVLGVMTVYAVLKMTGVIEAIAPDRTGVF